MKISEDCIKEIKGLEESIRSATEESKQVVEQKKQHAAEGKRVWNSMNIRERYFFGWFGGDKAKVARFKALQNKAEQAEGKVESLKEKIQKTDKKIQDKLNEYLLKNDLDYQKLFKPYDASRTMQKSVDDFLGTIDSALSSVNSAQGSESLDLVTDSKLISFISSADNSSANSSIASVEDAVAPFRKSLEKYGNSLENYEAPNINVRIDDTLDLIFDISFSGFDFMSMATLSQLGDAERALQNVRAKVEKVEKIVKANFNKAELALNAYVKQARLSCLS